MHRLYGVRPKVSGGSHPDHSLQKAYHLPGKMHKMRHLQTGLSYGLGETEMKTVKAVINNRDIEVQTGTTVLQAAQALNIRIPTLCHLNGYEQFTSCMVCVVLDAGSDRLIPSCSAAVSEGQRSQERCAGFSAERTRR